METLQACDFLEQWPTLTMLRKVRPSQLHKFYRQHSSPLPADRIDQRIEAIRTAIELTTDEAVIAPAVMLVRALVAQIRAVAMSIHEYDRRIAVQFVAGRAVSPTTRSAISSSSAGEAHRSPEKSLPGT